MKRSMLHKIEKKWLSPFPLRFSRALFCSWHYVVVGHNREEKFSLIIEKTPFSFDASVTLNDPLGPLNC